MMGWEDMEEPAAPDMRSVLQKREDCDRLFLRVFGDEDGAKVMDLLVEWYLGQPVATPGADASFAFYREGQNAVVRDIQSRLRRASNV